MQTVSEETAPATMTNGQAERTTSSRGYRRSQALLPRADLSPSFRSAAWTANPQTPAAFHALSMAASTDGLELRELKQTSDDSDEDHSVSNISGESHASDEPDEGADDAGSRTFDAGHEPFLQTARERVDSVESYDTDASDDTIDALYRRRFHHERSSAFLSQRPVLASCCTMLILAIVVLTNTFTVRFGVYRSSDKRHNNKGGVFNGRARGRIDDAYDPFAVPLPLLKALVYNNQTDFHNSVGVIPPFWRQADQLSTTPAEDDEDRGSNRFLQTAKPRHVRPKTSVRGLHSGGKSVQGSALSTRAKSMPFWGPCYKPLKFDDSNRESVDWDYELNHTLPYRYAKSVWTPQQTSIAGLCRPGFIILGAGKCGTSSLYHYLVGHPNVLPAKSKQIHYFTYHKNMPLSWYYSHFPVTANFLANGALMTGEASPGYLPYPDAAHSIARTYGRLKSKALGLSLANQQQAAGQGTEQVSGASPLMSEVPRMVAVGRDPLQRSYSSYRYNYVAPTIEYMKKGKVAHIPKNLTKDEEYEPYLLTFEQMIEAELAQLRKCLGYWTEDGTFVAGFGANRTATHWKPRPWARQLMDKYDGLYDHVPTTGQNNQLRFHKQLVDLDEVCYGGNYKSKIPRIQWKDVIAANPEKVLLRSNAFLTSTLIGRSLYVLPLEWWYLQFERSDLYFMCTEELSDPTGEPLNDVSMDFLGLPRFDGYSEVVAQGAYNVGGHRGYDEVTSWDVVKDEHSVSNDDGNRRLRPSRSLGRKRKNGHGSTPSAHQDPSDKPLGSVSSVDVPLSTELRKQYLDFVRPYNERLFALVGKRCNWDG